MKQIVIILLILTCTISTVMYSADCRICQLAQRSNVDKCSVEWLELSPGNPLRGVKIPLAGIESYVEKGVTKEYYYDITKEHFYIAAANHDDNYREVDLCDLSWPSRGGMTRLDEFIVEKQYGRHRHIKCTKVTRIPVWPLRNLTLREKCVGLAKRVYYCQISLHKKRVYRLAGE